MSSNGVPVSKKFYETMWTKIDRQAEFDYGPDHVFRYQAKESMKANLKEALDDLKDLNPVAAFKRYDDSEEMRGVYTITAPLWLPIVVLSAIPRAIKDAVVDNLMHAGIAAYHKLSGKKASAAGAEAVE